MNLESPWECFQERGAFVTGVGGGIGLAVTHALAAAGAHVVGVDVKGRPSEWPEGATYLQGDLTDRHFLAEAVEAVAATDLKSVVNAAGITMWGRDTSAVEVPDDVWELTQAVNLRGPLDVVRATLPYLRLSQGASYVHIASTGGVRNMTVPIDAYTASKASLIAMSRSLAIRLAPEGIRSNTVLPGPVRTPMLASHLGSSEESWTAMAQRVPLGLIGEPSDIAAAVLYLLSDLARFVTGIDLVVDGGMLARP